MGWAEFTFEFTLLECACARVCRLFASHTKHIFHYNQQERERHFDCETNLKAPFPRLLTSV